MVIKNTDNHQKRLDTGFLILKLKKISCIFSHEKMAFKKTFALKSRFTENWFSLHFAPFEQENVIHDFFRQYPGVHIVKTNVFI